MRSKSRAQLARAKEIAATHGLTIERYDLLLCLLAAPDGSRTMSIGELGRHLHLQQTAVTELVNRAESAGLVRRARSESDTRVTLVVLEDAAAQSTSRVFNLLGSGRSAFDDIVGDAGQRDSRER